MAKNWKAGELAKVAKVSYSTLRALFKQTQSETLKAFLSRTRLEQIIREFNLFEDLGDKLTPEEVVNLILKRLPETQVNYKDLTFGGDMRDISVSFDKIQRELEFNAELTVDDGVREILDALRTGFIRNPQDQRYRNAQFIVQ